MDDPLKGKIFQSPQGQSIPSGQTPPPPTSEAEKSNFEQTSQIPEEASSQPSNKPPAFESNITSGEPALEPEPQPSTPVYSPEESEESASSQSFAPQDETQTQPPSEPPFGFSIRNIVKLLLGLFVVLILIFVLVGLVLPNINKKEQKVELTFWDISDSSTISNVIADFEKQNPNIKVNLVKQDIKEYKDRLVTRVSNGTGPDIFRFHNTWVIQLSDVLLPVPSDIITKDTFDKTFYPVVKHDLVKNGAIYGIPIELDTLSLFINSELLKTANVNPPTNWNDFITTARALTLKDQDSKIKTGGAGIGTFTNVTHAPDIVSLLFAQDSVNLDDISQTKARVADALNFYTGFALSDGSVWDLTLDPTILAFSKGNLAMYFGYYKDRSVIKTANSSLAFDIVSVPHLTGQNQTMASYYALGVSLKSKHQQESLLLLKFLSQKDVVEKLTPLPLARIDVPDRSKGVSQDAISSYFSGETFDNGLNTNLNTHLVNAISSILSGESVDSAADNLILGFSQVLNQYLPRQ